MSDEPAHTGTSIDKVEILVGIGEGPIEGLKDGLKTFYFGDTPVQQQDGTISFAGLTIDVFPGDDSPDPIYLTLGGSASSQTVGVQLLQNIPVSRTTGNGNINFLDVRILANQIMKTDGGAWGVGFNILYKKTSEGSGAWRAFAGSETNVLGHKDINGHFTNQVFEWRQAVQPLTDGDTWDIQVVKTTPESDSKYLRDITWESFQEIVSGNKAVPNVAMVHVQAQASNQFSTVPSFWGVYRGYKCRVPTNYNPITRNYSGIWDGTFQIAWTNDPAWILYEVVMNSKWGFNAYYPCTIDKYDCYAASQWCSQGVPDGSGGAQPRYTYNRWISDPMDAMDLVNTIAGSFGGRCFDDQNGTILLRMDTDTNATILFTPENVENGLFNYSYTDLDQRYNDLTITFKNPDLQWQQDRRYIFNQDSIDEIGKIHLDYQLDDCTNVHESIRRGYLRMISTITEKEQVAFNTNRLGCVLQPFEIFLVADPDMGYGLSGRVKSISNDRTTIFLRDPLPLEANVLYTFSFQTPFGILPYDFGTLSSGAVTSITFPAPLDASITQYTTFNVGSEFNFVTLGVPSGPTISTIGMPKPYRCLKIAAVDNNPDKVQIVGMEVNRAKWAAADNATFANEIDYSNRTPGTDVKPPVAPFTFNYVTRTLNGKTSTTLTLNWGKSADMFLSRYRIEYNYEGQGSQLLTETVNTSVNFDDPKPGTYTFHVYAVNTVGNPSAALSNSTTVGAATAALPPSPITGLEIAGQGNNPIFTTKDVKFDWRLNSTGQQLDFDDEDALQGAESGTQDSSFANFLLQFFDGETGVFFFQDVTTDPFYTLSFDNNYNSKNGPHRNIIIKVFYRDIYGTLSTPASLAVSNPPPQQITGLTSADGDALVTFIWPKSLEPDISGYILQTAQDDGVHGFVHQTTYNGPNNTYVFSGVPGKEVRAKVGAYDTFDGTVQFSAEYSTTVPFIDGAHLDEQTQADIQNAFNLAVQGRDAIFKSGIDYAQAFEDLSANIIQLLTNAEGLTQLVREAGIEVDPLTGAVTIYSVKNLTGIVTGQASAIFNVTTAINGNALVTTSDTPPENPQEGDLWVDSSTGDNTVYRWNGVSWVFFGPVAATVYSQAQSIIALQSMIDDPTTGLVATAAALSSLTTTVTSQGMTITSQGVAITNLTNIVNDPTTGVVATSNALTSLTSVVTTQGTTLTAQAVSITSLNSTVFDPVTGVTANATAISTLTTSVTTKSSTFVQGTTPTALAVGDLWINTAAGNTILSWSGSAWVGRADLNKATTFAQTSTPTATAVGDIWINTTGGANTMSRWSGSAWVAVDNPVIASTASSVTALTATVGGFSATGLFRVYVASTLSGAQATVGISASATGVGGTQTASLFISALSGGTARVDLVATQFYVTDGTTRATPFYVSGGNVYINNAFITNLDASVITTGTLYAGAIVAGSITTSKLAGASVTETQTYGFSSGDSLAFSSTTSKNTLSSSTKTFLSTSFVTVEVGGSFYLTGTSTNSGALWCVRSDGTVIAGAYTAGTVPFDARVMKFIDNAPIGGSAFYYLQLRGSYAGSGTSTLQLNTNYIQITELKR